MTGSLKQRKTLIQGGTLLTMVPGKAAFTGDLLFSDEGLLAIAPTIKSDPAMDIVSAKGCYVLPGFVQSHVHFCQTLFRGRAEQVPLMKWLQNFIWPMEAAHNESSLRISTRLTLAELLLGGTTAALDMGTVNHTDVLFEESIRAGFRLTTGKAMMDRGPDPMGGLLESTSSSLNTADALAKKWHGAGDGLVHYAFAPRFILSCTNDLMKETVRLARRHKTLIHTHASENPGEIDVVKERYGKGNIGALADLDMVGEDVVLAHCVLPDEGEMELLRSSRTAVAHCPSTNLKLASGVAPIPEYLQAGVRVGMGADGAPCNNRLDMFTEMRMAGLIQKPQKGADALPAQSILEMATRGGADVLGLGAHVGQLKVGMQADVQIVNPQKPHLWPSSDPYTHLVYSAQSQDVSHVWVKGRPKVVDGALVDWDLPQLRHQSNKAINELMERLASS